MVAALSLSLSLSCQMPLKSGLDAAVCAEAQVAKNHPVASSRRDERVRESDMSVVLAVSFQVSTR